MYQVYNNILSTDGNKRSGAQSTYEIYYDYEWSEDKHYRG